MSRVTEGKEWREREVTDTESMGKGGLRKILRFLACWPNSQGRGGSRKSGLERYRGAGKSLDSPGNWVGSLEAPVKYPNGSAPCSGLGRGSCDRSAQWEWLQIHAWCQEGRKELKRHKHLTGRQRIRNALRKNRKIENFAT